VFERAFAEQRRSLIGWSLGLFCLAVVMTAIYPTVRGNPLISRIHEIYPKAFLSMFGITDMTTGAGFLRAELFSLIVPMLMVAMAVMWGGDIIAGEEDRGTIDLLLANPVSRRRVLFEKWAALLIGIVVVVAGLAVGFAVTIPIVHMRISWPNLMAVITASALLSLCFGTFAMAVGAASGRRGFARGVIAMVAVVAYLVSVLPDLVSWLRPVRPLSPWYHALGVDPLTTGFRVGHLAVVVALTIIAFVAGMVRFNDRDLGV
jgi:ABC-2 type transport system permease protein